MIQSAWLKLAPRCLRKNFLARFPASARFSVKKDSPYFSSSSPILTCNYLNTNKTSCQVATPHKKISPIPTLKTRPRSIRWRPNASLTSLLRVDLLTILISSSSHHHMRKASILSYSKSCQKFSRVGGWLSSSIQKTPSSPNSLKTSSSSINAPTARQPFLSSKKPRM